MRARDQQRLSFVGYSLGAVNGAVLAAIEGPRLKAEVLAAFYPRYTNIDYLEVYDPIEWVRRTPPTRLLIQLG